MALPFGLYFMYNENMARSISVIRKKKARGRPATGQDPLIALRMPPETITALDTWAEKQGLSRSEAVRQLVEWGLKR